MLHTTVGGLWSTMLKVQFHRNELTSGAIYSMFFKRFLKFGSLKNYVSVFKCADVVL